MDCTTKFEFPAIFSAVPQPIGLVPEINVNWGGPVLPWKFQPGRFKDAGLVRIVTDRQTDGRRAGAPYAGTSRARHARLLTHHEPVFSIPLPPSLRSGSGLYESVLNVDTLYWVRLLGMWWKLFPTTIQGRRRWCSIRSWAHLWNTSLSHRECKGTRIRISFINQTTDSLTGFLAMSKLNNDAEFPQSSSQFLHNFRSQNSDAMHAMHT